MGYLLMFARSMQLTARKNQLNYETIMIQDRQQSITNQLSQLQMMADSMPKDSPNLQYLEMQKQMLTMMNNNLETRLKYIQTQLNVVAAEEQKAEETLQAQIAASTPKYVG